MGISGVLGRGKNGLTGTQLKALALVLMVLDHIYEFFDFAGAPVLLHWLGRLSAPLFLFCTAEGFAHTHSRAKYTARIYAVSAGMALISWAMQHAGLWQRADGFVPINGIFQCFFLLCIQWQGIDWLQNGRKGRGAALFLLPAVWTAAEPLLGLQGAGEQLLTALLPTIDSMPEGGWPFLTEGLVLYALRKNRRGQIAAWVCTVLAVQLGWYGLLGYPMRYLLCGYAQWFSVFAAVFMLQYNGKRGRPVKALFYGFYPAHIYALYFISCLCFMRVAESIL